MTSIILCVYQQHFRKYTLKGICSHFKIFIFITTTRNIYRNNVTHYKLNLTSRKLFNELSFSLLFSSSCCRDYPVKLVYQRPHVVLNRDNEVQWVIFLLCRYLFNIYKVNQQYQQCQQYGSCSAFLWHPIFQMWLEIRSKWDGVGRGFYAFQR